MIILNNISFLFRDGKKHPPQGEQWRKLLHQISDIVENFILVFYNKLTKGRLFASCILHPASCILHPA
jgi:nucleoside-diphosphate-sugar epimerase